MTPIGNERCTGQLNVRLAAVDQRETTQQQVQINVHVILERAISDAAALGAVPERRADRDVVDVVRMRLTTQRSAVLLGRLRQTQAHVLRHVYQMQQRRRTAVLSVHIPIVFIVSVLLISTTSCT